MMSDNAQRQKGLSVGAKRYLLLGFLLVTWVFWNVAVFHCTFLKIGEDETDYRYRSSYGLFSKPYYDENDSIYTCVVYHPSEDLKEFEAAENAARFFGAFGYTTHTLVILLVNMAEFFIQRQSKALWTIIRVLVVISLLCSLAIFCMFATEPCTGDSEDEITSSYYFSRGRALLIPWDVSYEDVNCAPGPAGLVAIFNVPLLVFAVTLSWLIAPPEHPMLMISRWSPECADTNQKTQEGAPQQETPRNHAVADTYSATENTRFLDRLGTVEPQPAVVAVESQRVELNSTVTAPAPAFRIAESERPYHANHLCLAEAEA